MGKGPFREAAGGVLAVLVGLLVLGPGRPVDAVGADFGVLPAIAATIAPSPAARPTPTIPPYDRADWKHWIDRDGDCQDTRQEVLLRDSTAPVATNRNGCKVLSGRYFDPYSGRMVETPKRIDVDHMVPLLEAHLSGGWAWTPAHKQAYANFLDDPCHLIATDRSLNRSKGGKDPASWQPPVCDRTGPREPPADPVLCCYYAACWMSVKLTWRLAIDPVEAAHLAVLLGSCPLSAPPAGRLPGRHNALHALQAFAPVRVDELEEVRTHVLWREPELFADPIETVHPPALRLDPH